MIGRKRYSGMGYCPGDTRPWYEQWFCQTPVPQVVAPPKLPSGASGEVALPPPGSGGGMTLPTDPSQAGDVVTGIVNQQMIDQQNLNAQGVTPVSTFGIPSWLIPGGASSGAPGSPFPWGTLLLAGGVIVLLIATVGLGTPHVGYERRR